MSKINPNTGTFTTVTVGNDPVALAFDGTDMWVTNRNSDNVSRLVPPQPHPCT